MTTTWPLACGVKLDGFQVRLCVEANLEGPSTRE